MQKKRLISGITAILGWFAIAGGQTTLFASTDSPKQETSAKRKANADVVFVKAVQNGKHTWDFHVTVRHPDTGWDDYADGWDVLTPDGKVIKTKSSIRFTRALAHPHVNEQPFTRSVGGVAIPTGVSKVRVRAHDSVDGFGGREVLVDLTVDSGPDFKLERR